MNALRAELPSTPDAHDFPTRRYDLVKEFVIALAVVLNCSPVVLAALFSSPDETAISFKSWATAAPNDVVATATAELAGTFDERNLRPAVQLRSRGPEARSALAAEVGRRPDPRRLQPGRGGRRPLRPGRDHNGAARGEAAV